MLSNRTLLIFEPHPARARLYVARTSGFVARVLLARTIEDLERVHEKDVVLRVVSLSGSDGARTRELASIRRSGSDVATYVLDSKTYQQEDFRAITLVGHAVRTELSLSAIVQQLERLL
jgi:glutathionyl-hydroquinone reductase